MFHYTLKFRGVLYLNINTQNDFPYEEKRDGYCYVDGHKITNNPEGKETIRKSLCNASYYGSEDIYIKCEYRIDSKGYVIIEDRVSSGNKAEFYVVRSCKTIGNILNKIFG